MVFHANTIQSFESNLKRLREQLVASGKRIERCRRELTEAEQDHADLLTGINDSAEQSSEVA